MRTAYIRGLWESPFVRRVRQPAAGPGGWFAWVATALVFVLIVLPLMLFLLALALVALVLFLALGLAWRIKRGLSNLFSGGGSKPPSPNEPYSDDEGRVNVRVIRTEEMPPGA